MSNQPDDLSHRKTQQGGLALGQGAQITIGQGDIVVGDKTVNILAGKEDARARRDQLILLNKVKEFWVKGVLEKSVHSEAVIKLGKEVTAEAVDRPRPWDMTLEAPEQPSQPIPPNKKIIELFDEMEHALLILGAPGSGKTITLLELACDLIARSESDPAQPIPVVFNLSAWAERKLPLAEWLANELSLKYQIPRKIGRKWLAAADILPLLDGLDEVRAEHRSDCVEAINKFYDEYSLAGIAVCSRYEEYSLLKAKLKLGGAILIQPLNDEQVMDYLASFGAKLAGLYKALRLDTTLKELAASPLMLGVMSLAYADVSLEDVLRGKLDSIEARRKHLFEAYVERMFKRKGANKGYAPEQTTRWLVWLARGMKAQGQSVFLIEGLQPSWLEAGIDRWANAILSSLFGGLIIGVSVGLFFLPWETGIIIYLRDILTGVISGVIGGIIIGLVNGWRFRNGGRVVGSDLSPGRWRSILGFIFVGAISGLIIWPAASLFSVIIRLWFLQQTVQLLAIVIFGLLFGMVSGIAFGFVFGRRIFRVTAFDAVQTVERLSWSWSGAMKNAVGGMVGGLLGGLVLGVPIGLLVGPLITPLIESDNVGFTTLLAICLCSASSSGLGATVLSMISGLIGGLRGNAISHKMHFNQGIRQSTRNALIAGTLFWLMGWLLFVAIQIGLFALLNDRFLRISLNLQIVLFFLLTGAFAGLSVGLIGALSYGGLAVIQHYALRFGVSLTQPHLPFNLARFLDYCADRIFLQKIGGGYIFIHRLLLEYFAESEPLKH